MQHHLYPDDYVSSTYHIDFAKLYEEGYRGLIFDIDNTLVPHGAPADARAIALFQNLHQIGFRCMFVSNNKEPRVKSFSDAVNGYAYIYKANKPSPFGYVKAMQQMKTNTSNTLFIGDQILTDIWGANRAGIRTVMVEPVLKWKEEIQIVFKRLLEAVILKAYQGYRGRNSEKIRPVPLIMEDKT